jgi:hypothetical protein
VTPLELLQNSIAKITISIFQKKGQETSQNKTQISQLSRGEIPVTQEIKRYHLTFLIPNKR